MHFKVFGSRMKMKEDALPHKYLRKPIPQELIYKSQLDDVDRKRRAEQLDRLEKMKVQRLDTLDDSARSEVNNTDVSYTYSNLMDPLSMESSGKIFKIIFYFFLGVLLCALNILLKNLCLNMS